MNTKTWINLIAAFVLLVTSFGVAPLTQPNVQAKTIVRVKPGGSTTAGCGSTWGTACELQTALTTASAGVEIWAAAGTYKPGTNRQDTFKLKSGVALYGGFAGTETELGRQDWVTNLSVLSGDIGVLGDDSDNSYLVVTSNSVDATAILNGFIITGGNSDIPTYGYGGGMRNSGGSPTLTNLVFSDNYAFDAGGGMYSINGSPSLTNVTFSGNQAMQGGGMYNLNGSPSLINVTFSGNEADGCGGMDNTGSPSLVRVIFNDNIGGGMCNSGNSYLNSVIFSNNTAGEWNTMTCGMRNWDSNPKLFHVIFTNNSADSWSGGMCNWDSNPTLAYVIFSGNRGMQGGGIYNHQSNPSLVNVTFSANWALNSGGGIYNEYSSPTLTNVTFSGNSAEFGGGIFNQESSNPTITNSIMWGNTAETSGPQIYNHESISETSKSFVQYSDIQGGCSSIPRNDCSGGGNIAADPLFTRDPNSGPDGTWGTADDDYGDLRLKYGSPVIDAGDNTKPGLVGISYDLDLNPRFYDVPGIADTGIGTPPVVDMGAYERQATQPPTARDDIYNTVSNSPLNIDAPGILINDINPGEEAIYAVLVNGPYIGSLTFNPDGSFKYQPNKGYFGVVTFRYRARDGLLNSNIGTVTIIVGYSYLPLIMR